MYDVLNVQYAANVLLKDGSDFKPNYQNAEFKEILKNKKLKIIDNEI